MRFAVAVTTLLSAIGMASCASGPMRTEQVSLARIENVHGYNEFGGQLLASGRVSVERLEGADGYLVGLYDSWLVLLGKPSGNPYWFKSDDTAVKIRLVRRTQFAEDATPPDPLAAVRSGGSPGLEVLALVGHVSVETEKDGYRLLADLKSAAAVGRNEAWLLAVEKAPDHALLSQRLKAAPGDSGAAVIKGPIISIKVFTGW